MEKNPFSSYLKLPFLADFWYVIAKSDFGYLFITHSATSYGAAGRKNKHWFLPMLLCYVQEIWAPAMFLMLWLNLGLGNSIQGWISTVGFTEKRYVEHTLVWRKNARLCVLSTFRENGNIVLTFGHLFWFKMVHHRDLGKVCHQCGLSRTVLSTFQIRMVTKFPIVHCFLRLFSQFEIKSLSIAVFSLRKCCETNFVKV